MNNTSPKNGETQAVIMRLAELFPKAIFVYEQRRRPLAVGIHNQISEQVVGTIAPDELGHALRAYVRNVGYLRAMSRGGPRIDLEGNSVGVVSPEQQASAAKAVAAHFARQAARKAATRMACAEPEAASRPASSGTGGTVSVRPKRLGLADLRQAALERKAAAR
jgi:sRNA-binding protein